MKRFIAFWAAMVLILLSPSAVFACNQEQTEIYMSQILFGDNYLVYESDENVKLLSDALYLCCEQTDKAGAAELEYLKEKKVAGLPSLSKISIQSDDLYQCSHNSWEYVYTSEKKKQDARKKILRSSVNKVFDFGFLNELLNSNKGKANSFAALLYYSHILSDYLSDDPEETETQYGGIAIPAYSGQPFVEINGNQPAFSSIEKKNMDSFERYSELDSLGRCGAAYVNVCDDLMPPADSRQQIGAVKPSGWNQGKYPGIVSSAPAYLWNRCHLIAHELAGNDANNNLITGTRYLNETGMLPFEDEVANYVRKSGNHVLYRSTPVFEGDNLIASGVQIEAYSVEDKGAGICFNVYCYNVQPGININYASGQNEVADETYNNDKVLPFAVPDPNESSPDFMYELERHLEILFEEQKESMTYISMIQEMDSIANEAREICGDVGTDAKSYQVLKRLEYQYLDVMKSYIPKLLGKEDFFQKVFS